MNASSSQKSVINDELLRLGASVDFSTDLPAVDGAGGPWAHLKSAAKVLYRDALLDNDRFAGSWLDAVVCMEQELPLAEQFIIAGVLPPARMIADAATALTPEQREVVRQGATVCIRPPSNALLVLSPVTADAKVYELGEQGLVELGENVASFVCREVGTLLATR
jgi:hypothetical protein